MYGVKIVCSLLLLSLTICASSCTQTRVRGHEVDLLSTGLVGWQQVDGQEGTWHFKGGVLCTEGENGGWLATHRQYENFVLALEFRVPPGGNSGVFIRAPLQGDPAYTGMEIQILDDRAEQWSGLQAFQYMGSIYGVQAPSERVSKKAGEWQEMVIVARGSEVQVILNGRKIIDTVLTRYLHKLDEHPGLLRPRGHIGLQNHGSRVEFRHIRLRELPDALS